MPKLPARGNNPAARNIHKVFILGGVHGNERAGIHAVQYIRDHVEEFKCGAVRSIETLLGNPRAILRNARYIDTDLNRSFKYDYRRPQSEEEADLVASGGYAYEAVRALEIRRELKALLRPVDFLIDLHTTTSNMGNCLIVSGYGPWTAHLCGLAAQKIPRCRVLHDPVSREDDPASSSLGMNQITLEMGPVQQGIGDYRTVQTALEAVKAIIKGVDELNGRRVLTAPVSSPAPRFDRLPYKVDYPRDKNGIATAVINCQFMGKDFMPLAMGQPVFTRLDGGKINFGDAGRFPEDLVKSVEQGETVAPLFIGEAAYMEKGLAFITAKPVQL